MTTSNRKPDEPKVIDAEIISESPAPKTTPLTSLASGRTFFHPVSGLAILFFDWIAFGLDLPTGMILTAVTSLGAFIATFAAVYWIQRREANDLSSQAITKALIGAVAAGVPFPITGTLVGAGILLLSGLPTSAKDAVTRTFKK